ncbi:Phloem protein 2-like [Dillenia turbinata]|uniref:Phloem protein 2-like n=1 Tax=Dillenia turbinata TaxID=194707 RepID=A0AAN8V8R3_9MAGN
MGILSLLELPEDCIAKIVSMTSAADACRSCTISKGFKSVADSDTVWENFLPSDYKEIIASTSNATIAYNTRKELYFCLCHPLVLEEGERSFNLVKKNGKKCYMLGARNLHIFWGNDHRCWVRLVPLPNTRFGEVAELRQVCWVKIVGRLETRLLSPATNYAAYLVFTPIREYTSRFGSIAGKVSATIINSNLANQSGSNNATTAFLVQNNDPQTQDGQLPREREDGWKEIKMGEFYVTADCGGIVEMRLDEVEDPSWKTALLVYGIEIRPI